MAESEQAFRTELEAAIALADELTNVLLLLGAEPGDDPTLQRWWRFRDRDERRSVMEWDPR